MGARLAGAGKIIAVDILDQKLETARELGADVLINASKEDPQQKIAELTGIGADAAIECIGNVDVMLQAFGSIHNGGKCVVAGMAPLGAVLNIAPFEFLLGKTITGSVQGEINPFEDVPRYVDMFMEGKVPFEKMITKSYGLEEINEAFEALEKGEVVRSVIKY